MNLIKKDHIDTAAKSVSCTTGESGQAANHKGGTMSTDDLWEWDCNCDRNRTDGQNPCGKGLNYQRPDGKYCDCGHDTECCKEYKIVAQ